jgi:hypothetical protein
MIPRAAYSLERNQRHVRDNSHCGTDPAHSRLLWRATAYGPLGTRCAETETGHTARDSMDEQHRPRGNRHGDLAVNLPKFLLYFVVWNIYIRCWRPTID